VQVNPVASGPVNAPLVTDDLPRSGAKTMPPLGRFGESHEVAETVSFLASDPAVLYVGQTLGPNLGDVTL
jgi:3-oxoacyl-[acyl-carrier protein] reductase